MVEILVVVAVVAVLTAVTLPTIRGIKQRANTIKCLNNLRQIGSAFQLYLAENKGVFPPCADYISWRGPSWQETTNDLQFALNDYVGPANGTHTNNMGSKIWICDSAEKFAWKSTVPGTWTAALPDPPYYLGAYDKKFPGGYKHNITYRYNSKPTRGKNTMQGPGIGTMTAYPQYMCRLTQPGKAALMWDLPDELGKPALAFKYHNSLEMHGNGVNCLFVDGHVQTVPVAYNFAGTQGLDVPGTLWWYASEWKGKGWDGAKVPGTDQP
jgi:prepilin-type processing-associated H-X9-DG protein